MRCRAISLRTARRNCRSRRLAGRRGAGIHDQRPGSAIRLGLRPHPLQLEETPVEIELLARRPGELDDIEPFSRVFVARLMVAQGRAEHLELALVPAAYQIEAEAPFTDVVGGDELLGGDQRRDQGRMHGAEHDEPPGLGQQPAGPAHRLPGLALVVGQAAIPLPAPDRQHELDAGPVGHLRQPDAIGPAPGPALRHHRDRTAGGAVGAEQAELEPVGAAHRSARSVANLRVQNPHHRLSLPRSSYARPESAAANRVRRQLQVKLRAIAPPHRGDYDPNPRREPPWSERSAAW